MKNKFDLSGKVVAVIGGTGILGGTIARGLAEHGAYVGIMGRNKERGEGIAKVIGSSGCFFACDALDMDSLRCARDELVGRWGSVSVLVNAAGGNYPRATVANGLAFEDIGLGDWKDAFELNLVGGALLPSQIFGSGMVDGGDGSIINIASVAAHVPLSRVVAYSAAKAAIISLTQFLAREWAPKGVRVNSITPGFFPAEQNRKLLYENDGTPTSRAKMILQHTPMNRFGNPDELIGAAVFLSSSEASGFVTGTDIRVDGGFLSSTI